MKKKKTMKRGKKLGIILGSAVCLVVILFLGAVEFTSSSRFCASCHYMKPYFQSWKTSSHNDVECRVCHYPPGGGLRSTLRKKVEGLVMVGRYWTKLYVKSKPWAEIRDESCLREGCHEKRLLEGRVQFHKVVFDHKIHLTDLKRGKNLQCTSCHSQIVQGQHITVTESSCFICHFKKSDHYPRISECSHCHTKETLTSEASARYNHSVVFDNGFSCEKCHSNTIIGDGEVPRENCFKCHMERERLEKFKETDLLHTAHISENKIECNQCHREIQHKILKDIHAIADCTTCHMDYHQAQKILYAGEGGKGVSHPMPNIMLEKGLSCKGCHIFHEETGGKALKSETFVAGAAACESCHGKGFSRIMREWEAATEKKLHQIKAIYSRAFQEVRRSHEPGTKQSLSLLKEALFNIELVEKGKSVHNMSFSQELLLAAYTRINKALETVKASYRPPEFAVSSGVVPTQCSNCHTGIEEINTRVFGLEFPHKKHLVEKKIPCTTCHSNVRTHGEFIATKKSCAACHHEAPHIECAQCHQLQTRLYQGGEVSGQAVSRDIMAEAEVECADCHFDDRERLIRPARDKCVECHDEDYGVLFDEWQDTIRSLTGDIRQALDQARKRALTQEESRDVQQAEQFLEAVTLDGSSGIHNFAQVEEILTSLKKKIESLRNTPE